MIQLKTPEQIEIMKVAGRITGEALLVAKELIKEGITTKQIDDKIRMYIKKCGAKPTFLGYGGFPGSACISINEEVIHGIPSHSRVLKNGDIVKIDVGAQWKGFTGDSAATFAVGEISEEAKKLIKTTEECFFKGIEAIEKADTSILSDFMVPTEIVLEVKEVKGKFEIVPSKDKIDEDVKEQINSKFDTALTVTE